jgi:hypothetical protein
MAQLLVAQNLSFHRGVFTEEVLQGQGQQRPEEVVAEQRQMEGGDEVWVLATHGE